MQLKKTSIRHWTAGLCGAVALAAGAAPPQPADLVVRNGQIHTMRRPAEQVQAFAVRDGRYVAVGDNAAIDRLVGPATRVIDLAGAMAMPGIGDVHMHPLDGAYEALFACDIGPDSDLPRILARVADCAGRAGPDDWVVGGAWSGALLAQVGTPAALAALDRAGAGHPVVLRDDSFHNRWANSAALRLAGITAASTAPGNGVIDKDPATGEPTGLLKEFAAFATLERAIPARTAARLSQAAEAAGATLGGYGITAVQDAFSNEDMLRVWRQTDRDGKLPLHMVSSLAAMPTASAGGAATLALVDERRRYAGPHLHPSFAKLFLDGVPPARTAAFLEPYLPDQEHGAHFHGKSNFTRAQLADQLAALDRRGIAVKLHATGDASLRLALDAIEDVRKRNGMPGQRHQIAHASFIADSDIGRFKRLNVTADISPMLWYPTGLGAATAAAIGPERANHMFPVRDLVKAGALVAGGSDWPAGQATPDPWRGIEGLVTRRDPLGAVPGALWPEQAVDLDTALRIYTINSATAMGLGATTGSIAPGKSADFIVLNQNLFAVPPERIHETRVELTYFEGRPVYARARQAPTHN